MSSIYIRRQNKKIICFYHDQGLMLESCVDQGYLGVKSIVVGRVQTSEHGRFLVDLGPHGSGIFFAGTDRKDKSQKWRDGQKCLVQIRKQPQKEPFDVKPYEISHILKLSNDTVAFSGHKKGIQFSKDIADKPWRESVTNRFQELSEKSLIHFLKKAYQTPLDVLEDMVVKFAEQSCLYENLDLATLKSGHVVHSQDPDWISFVESVFDAYGACPVFSDDSDIISSLRNRNHQNVHFDLKPSWLHEFNTFIEDIMSPYVPLMGGGVLIVEEGQTLTAIDVNTSAGKSHSAFSHANFSAVPIQSDHDLFEFSKRALNEAVRQLYLRRIGGIVLVDLPRLQNQKHQKALTKIAKSYEGQDLQVLGDTKSGLYEFTKTKKGMSIQAALQDRKY